jgi:hypothetical protein
VKWRVVVKRWTAPRNVVDFDPASPVLVSNAMGPGQKPGAPSKAATAAELNQLSEDVTKAKLRLDQTQAEVEQLRISVAHLEEEASGKEMDKTTKALISSIDDWLDTVPPPAGDEGANDTSSSGGKGGAKRISRSELTAKQLVVAEQNMDLFRRVEKAKERLKRMQDETDVFRATLLVEVAGEDVNPDDYAGITTSKLLELYRQKVETRSRKQVRLAVERSGGSSLALGASIRVGGLTGGGSSVFGGGSAGMGGGGAQRATTSRNLIRQIAAEGRGRAAGAGGGTGADSQDPDRADRDGAGAEPPVPTGPMDTPEDLTRFELERQIAALKRKNQRMQKDVDALKSEVQQSGAEQGRADALQKRNENLGKRLNQERDHRLRVDKEVERAQKKVAKLAEHIERLMTHLKHESTAKLKHQKVVQRMEEELGALRLRSAALVKKMQMRERVIEELREGSQILEEQLRLMDSKYVDMRRKLDWTRDHTKQQVKKMTEEADLLRARWQLAGGKNLNLTKLVGRAAHAKTGPGRKVKAMLGPSQEAQDKMRKAQEDGE